MLNKLKTRRPAKKGGYWFLYLFGAIFLGVGLFTGALQTRTVAKCLIAKTWTEVPAVVLDARVEHSRNSDGNAMYRATGRYRYDFKGQTYESSQILYTMGSDSGKKFHRKIVADLKSHQKVENPLMIRVNPSRPDQAIAYPNIRWGYFAFMSIFTLAFGGVGAGIISIGMFGKRTEKRETTRAADHPDEPWVWRDIWQTRELKNNSKITMSASIAFAVFWNLISWPVAFKLPELMREEKEIWIAIFYSFPIIGLFMIYGAWKSYRQHRRYGRASLVLETFPAALGHAFVGTLKMPVAPVPGANFEVTLSCLRKEQRGSRNERRTVEVVMWQDEQIIPAQAGRFMNDYRLPIRFALPASERESSVDDSHQPILWRISIKSELGAIDFDQRYEIPVFDPDKWRIEIPAAARLDEKTDSKAFGHAGDWARTGVIYSEAEDGHYYYFPPARHKNLAVMITFMTLIFGGVGVAPFFSAMPFFFGIIFGLFGLLLGVWALNLWLFKSAIDVRPGHMMVRRGMFGGKFTDVAAEDIGAIKLDSTMSSGEVQYYDIVVQLKSGNKVKLADHILGKRDVENLIAQIKQDLGLQPA